MVYRLVVEDLASAHIQVTVTRFGLGMWQTITILQCPHVEASRLRGSAVLRSPAVR